MSRFKSIGERERESPLENVNEGQRVFALLCPDRRVINKLNVYVFCIILSVSFNRVSFNRFNRAKLLNFALYLLFRFSPLSLVRIDQILRISLIYPFRETEAKK